MPRTVHTQTHISLPAYASRLAGTSEPSDEADEGGLGSLSLGGIFPACASSCSSAPQQRVKMPQASPQQQQEKMMGMLQQLLATSEVD